MRRRKLVGSAISSAVVLGLAIASGAAFAQNGDDQEVRIQGAPVVTSEGWSRTGIQNQQVQLSQNVSYSDLDLATPSGESELKARVHNVADAICDRLGTSDEPREAIDATANHIQCVNSAVDNAMPHIRRAIASAEETQRRGW
jgi:UrcA family protein